MFGTLIESKAKVQRRGGGTMVSVFIHASIVVGAILLTATPTIGRLRPPSPKVIIYETREEPKPKPPEPQRGPVRAVVSASAPAIPRIDPPRVIPATIPPIDFSAPPTAIDFNERRAATPPCFRLCGSGDAAGDTSSTPLWSGADLAMRLRQPPTPPRYPEALRAAGVEGTVVIRFAVDTGGSVDPASIEVISSTHELFTAAARQTLLRLRFFPAEVGGRKLRATALMPFQFTLK
jgi:protein TonB